METSKFHNPTVIAIGVAGERKSLGTVQPDFSSSNYGGSKIWSQNYGREAAALPRPLFSLLLELDPFATGKLASEWRSRRINLQSGSFGWGVK